MTEPVVHPNGSHDDEYINPSIGRIGEMYLDERNNRIKYFCTDIHSSADLVDRILRQGLTRMMRQGATRLNARFFVREGYNNRSIEARIPLNNGFSGYDHIFVGMNEQERMSSPEVIEAENRLVSEVHARGESTRQSIPEGYSIERLNINQFSEADIKSMVDMYSEAFTTYTADLDEKSVRDMVRNSVVYAVRDREGQIVSTSVAEIAIAPLETGDFRICELSEMATRREHRGQGLVTFATRALIEDIRDTVDLLYAEARACHRPINQAFFNLGFEYAGRLNKQCILSGDHEVQEEGPYENLNVWFILPHELEG